MIEKLRHKLTNVYDFFRYGIPQGVHNLIVWFPIIWKYRTWDFYYTLTVLHKSLMELKHSMEFNSRHVGCDKDVKRMNICINLLNRICGGQSCCEFYDFSYHDMVFKNHNIKWGELDMQFGSINSDHNYTCIFGRKNARTEKEIEQEQKEYKFLMDKCGKLEKQDYVTLFNIIKKYSKGWWY